MRSTHASAAITERLNVLIEIGRPEHEAIEVARHGLVRLKAQWVDGIVGETLGPGLIGIGSNQAGTGLPDI